MAENEIDADIILRVVSKTFSLDIHNIHFHKNYKVSGISGNEYNFSDIVTSDTDIIAIKIAHEISSINDLITFNSQCMDAQIDKKILISDKELNENEVNICHAFKIQLIDLKNYQNGYSKKSHFGIAELDSKLSGGLRPGYVYLVSGKTGSGKTTLSSTFLATGAKYGEKGLMVLTDTFPDLFLGNIRTMNIGFAKFYEDRMIEIMEISDQIRVMKSDISNGKTDFRKFITKIVNELKKIIIQKDIKRVVIDPITLLLIPDDDYINIFLNSLAMKNVTTIITSGLRNSDLSMFGIEEYYTTGIIKLDYEMVDEKLSRTLKIVKMRGSVFDSSPSNFKITSNGIIMTDKNVIINTSADNDDIFKNIR